MFFFVIFVLLAVTTPASEIFCPSENVVALHHVAEVVLEVALNVRGVRPRPAQEGGRLKGPPAGAEGKVLGVQHDAGKQCLGLLPKDLGGLAEVL